MSDVSGFKKHCPKFSTIVNKNYTYKYVFVKFVAFRVPQTVFLKAIVLFVCLFVFLIGWWGGNGSNKDD